MNWVLFWLFLHILAAVIAFGPTFTFPLLGMYAQKNPQGLHMIAEIQHIFESRLVTPFAGSMLVSGIGLLVAANIDLLKSPYMIVAILLYLIALGLGTGVLAPAARKLVQVTEGGPPPGAAPGPPPAEVLALINRLRSVGMTTTVLFLVIIFLMIIKPGGLVTGPLFG